LVKLLFICSRFPKNLASDLLFSETISPKVKFNPSRPAKALGSLKGLVVPLAVVSVVVTASLLKAKAISVLS
jgi:hypothetical protein